MLLTKLFLCCLRGSEGEWQRGGGEKGGSEGEWQWGGVSGKKGGEVGGG